MSTTEMTVHAFTRMLERHGADASRWPERQAAERLVVRDAKARQLLEEARGLEDLLRASLPVPNPTAARMRADVRGRLSTGPSQQLVDWFDRGPLWRPLMAALLPLGLGFVLGLGFPEPAADDDLIAAVSLLAFDQGTYLDESLNASVEGGEYAP